MVGDKGEGTWRAKYLWFIVGRSFTMSASDGEAHGGAAKVMATGLDSGNPLSRALAKVTEKSRVQC